MVLSLGLRTDFNDYSKEMSNPLKQLSPRFSLSYSINEKWNYNFNIGRYFQLPAYTVLGYRDSTNTLVNKNNGVKECCEFIDVHATKGVAINSLLLWADMQRQLHPDD